MKIIFILIAVLFLLLNNIGLYLQDSKPKNERKLSDTIDLKTAI